MKKQKKVDNQRTNLVKNHTHPDGLDKWNDRLDHNMETEHEGDELADEHAKKYSRENGSGDQSDDKNSQAL